MATGGTAYRVGAARRPVAAWPVGRRRRGSGAVRDPDAAARLRRRRHRDRHRGDRRLRRPQDAHRESDARDPPGGRSPHRRLRRRRADRPCADHERRGLTALPDAADADRARAPAGLRVRRPPLGARVTGVRGDDHGLRGGRAGGRPARAVARPRVRRDRVGVPTGRSSAGERASGSPHGRAVSCRRPAPRGSARRVHDGRIRRRCVPRVAAGPSRARAAHASELARGAARGGRRRRAGGAGRLAAPRWHIGTARRHRRRHVRRQLRGLQPDDGHGAARRARRRDRAARQGAECRLLARPDIRAVRRSYVDSRRARGARGPGSGSRHPSRRGRCQLERGPGLPDVLRRGRPAEPRVRRVVGAARPPRLSAVAAARRRATRRVRAAGWQCVHGGVGAIEADRGRAAFRGRRLDPEREARVPAAAGLDDATGPRSGAAVRARLAVDVRNHCRDARVAPRERRVRSRRAGAAFRRGCSRRLPVRVAARALRADRQRDGDHAALARSAGPDRDGVRAEQS